MTGASGCVGHYLVEELVRGSEHELVLVLRNPGKLVLPPECADRVTIIEADVRDVDSYLDQLGHIDEAILAAACWGGPDTLPVNVHANKAIAEHLAAHGGHRVFYFSSASVLDRNAGLLQAAHDLGTEYIRSKYVLTEEMERLSGKIETIGVFPTLIVGGEKGKPMSHFANLLREVSRWAWLASFFRADGRFHFIHARDIARTVRILVDTDQIPLEHPARIVLGNPATTVNRFIEDFLRYRGIRNPLKVMLRESYAQILIKVFRIQLGPWDRYCMEHRDLSFQHAVNPDTLGAKTYCSDLKTALESIGIPGKAA
ncbi:MAG: NAD(P)-dependent oxidoreductase [Rhizobiaceae bacterium]|nr:NAD(P)-dependent oxidoreductase [Rhizobiaceae bacterium]